MNLFKIMAATGVFLSLGSNFVYGQRAVEFYTIQSGDTLSEIADRVYKDASKWQVLYKNNFEKIGTNPDTLRVGTKLRLTATRPSSVVSSPSLSENYLKELNNNSNVLLKVVEKMEGLYELNSQKTDTQENVAQSQSDDKGLEALLRREEIATDDLRVERDSWRKQAETLADALVNFKSVPLNGETDDEEVLSWSRNSND